MMRVSWLMQVEVLNDSFKLCDSLLFLLKLSLKLTCFLPSLIASLHPCLAILLVAFRLLHPKSALLSPILVITQRLQSHALIELLGISRFGTDSAFSFCTHHSTGDRIDIIMCNRIVRSGLLGRCGHQANCLPCVGSLCDRRLGQKGV